MTTIEIDRYQPQLRQLIEENGGNSEWGKIFQKQTGLVPSSSPPLSFGPTTSKNIKVPTQNCKRVE
jgi:hypothetical protein